VPACATYWLSACPVAAFLQQLTASEFMDLARAPHVKKVVLRRSNLLDVFVSELKAKEAGTYLKVNTSQIKVLVFLTDFRSFVKRADQEQACLREAASALSPASWLAVSYDELVGRRATTMAHVFAHLGVARIEEGTSLRTGLFKQEQAPHSSSIDNYAQLWRTFQGTRFAAMLRGAPPAGEKQQRSQSSL